jgi:hypothetical protein
MKTKKYNTKWGIAIIMLLLSVMPISCTDDYITGGINETNEVNLDTFDYLNSMDETKIVARLFEKAGLKDVINGKGVTVIAPAKWAVERYLRRRWNQDLRVNPVADPVTIDDITPEDLLKMGMYILPGGDYNRKTVPPEGLIVTAYDGTKIYLSYDKVYIDPGSAWDVVYRYSNFMQKLPEVLHVQFKRGTDWEWDSQIRNDMRDYYDNPECDHVYRVYLSDAITTNGTVHIIYQGDYNYTDHYYYHTLFFFGTRKDDLL